MLNTPRLLLRTWQESDKIPFAKLNADPDVMQYFPKALNFDESMTMMTKIQGLIDSQGFGFWAVEYQDNGEFIGFIGLHKPDYLPFSPCVEIGWRLHKAYWGQGLVVEGAKACLDFAFNELNLHEVVSFTSLLNKNSQRVMQKLGMTFDGEFNHPNVDDNSPLKRHCLYKIFKQDWQNSHD